ncbi:MAG: transcriptional repressor [Alphaproteobacteria bacterium]|nr:transcriptional repressor [Alphaproteobacteria bacterium]
MDDGQNLDHTTSTPATPDVGRGRPIQRGTTSRRPCLTAVLRMVGLRPTRQRLALAGILFGGGHRHVSAEQLHTEAATAGVKVSLATIYNTLHQFLGAGLLREVTVDAARSYFDTDTSDHHHFFIEEEQRVVDIPSSSIVIAGVPEAPRGMEVTHVDVVVRVRRRSR